METSSESMDLKSALALLERERELAAALHAVGESILRRNDLQQIVQEVTDASTKLCDARFGAFFYNSVSSGGEELMLYTLSGAPRSAFAHLGHPRATPIFRPTFEGTAIMRVADITRHPDFGRNPPHHGMPEGHLPVRSYLAVPVMLSDGSVAGGLFFGHPDPDRFTEDHERLVVGIASHAAIAIENVRLLDRERWARGHAEERAQAALSLEHVADGVFLVDDSGVVRVWNPAAERITDIPGADAIGRPATSLLDQWDEIRAQIPTSSTSDSRGHAAIVVPATFAGREVWLSMHGASFAGGTVYTFRDMTSERRLDQVREDMVATVSHELRTPLASVYGAAKTLQRTDIEVTDDMRDALVGLVASESARLSAIIDEFLLASSLGHEIELAPDTVDLHEIAADAAMAANARGVSGLDIHVRGEGPVLANVDEPKLRQVVSNLVDNALKYGEGGGRIEIEVQGSSERVHLSVRDHGRGIPPEELDRVFERFYRLDPKLRSGIRGTGLGLYISRELVERMGGSLTVSSTPGVETAFTLHLPAIRD